jgi:hypothetical protein
LQLIPTIAPYQYHVLFRDRGSLTTWCTTGAHWLQHQLACWNLQQACPPPMPTENRPTADHPTGAAWQYHSWPNPAALIRSSSNIVKLYQMHVCPSVTKCAAGQEATHCKDGQQVQSSVLPMTSKQQREGWKAADLWVLRDNAGRRLPKS